MKKYEKPIMEVTSFEAAENLMLVSQEKQTNINSNDVTAFPDIFKQ